MPAPFFHVSVFSRGPYSGNPCGVVLLESWPEETGLRALTAEIGLPTVAFIVTGEGPIQLRWFEGPELEVQLCGHGTLAAAKMLLDHIAPGDAVTFETRFSGALRVKRSENGFSVGLPRLPAEPLPDPAAVESAVGSPVEEALMAVKTLAVLPDAAAVRAASPRGELIGGLPADGLLITAPGDEAGIDFVARFFAPHRGVAEDSATGSAYCTLAPYWAARLGKTDLRARQLSPRGGEIFCSDGDERVEVGGRVTAVVQGELLI
ncbi:MAG: PhzF family phenazine biosynthesis protein [Rhodovibrionaceae bacterium]